MNLDIEIPNRNFHELCNVIKWKEAPHTYNKEELQAKSIADALYNNMTLDPDDVLKRSHSCAHGKEETFNYLLLTRVRDKDCVKNRVKRAKIVRFTLC